MRNFPLSAGTACFVVALGLANASAVRAATTVGSTIATGSACQLSIPTTDTKFRPKATGARNESTTTSNFVICPIPSPVLNSGTDSFKLAAVYIYSIDGASHDVTCTAVTGYNGSTNLKYSSKTLTVSSVYGAMGAPFLWSGADFGGANNIPIVGSATFSVTCLLPPQTAVNLFSGSYDYNIGA